MESSAHPDQTRSGPSKEADDKAEKLAVLIQRLNRKLEEEGKVEDGLTEDEMRRLIAAINQERRPTEFFGDKAPERASREFFGESGRYA